MRSLALTEWLLAQCTNRPHAASIVGDLIEDCDGRESIAFWWSLFTILCSFVWRAALGFAIALVFGLFSFDFLHSLVYGVYAPYLPPNGWRILVDFVCLMSILLAFGMPYTVIRYGLKDFFTQQVVAAWALTSILSVYWWMSIVMIAVTVLGTWCLLFSFFSATRRQALLASVVALGFATSTYWLAVFLTKNLAGSHVPIFHNLAFYVLFLGLALQPAIYSHVHTIFRRSTGTGLREV